MARHGPLAKPSMASMPVLLWLVDNPELVLVSSSVMNSSGYHYAYRDGRRYNYKEDGRTHLWDDDDDKPEWWNNPIPPHTSTSLAVHRWLQSDWIIKIEKKGDNWSWYSHPYAMTKEGIEMVNKHRSKYEEHARKQAEKAKEVERFVVVRSGKRKYGFLARVTKETAARLYVERVKEEGERSWQYFRTLHGNKNTYVERDDVTVDGITREQYDAARVVEDAHMAWLGDLKEQERAEIDEIRERYDARREQNQYAFEDELREAMERVKS